MSHQIHPLLVNHIVERILECYAAQDSALLLPMRLVSQVWHQVASACHRKRSKNVICLGKNFHTIPESCDFLLNKSSDVHNFPLGSFKLCPDVFQPGNETFLEGFFSGDFSLILTSLVIRLDTQSTLKFGHGSGNLSAAFSTSSEIHLPRLKNFSYDDRRSNCLAFDDIFNLLLQASWQNLESLSIHRKEIDGSSVDNDQNEGMLMMQRICDTLKSIYLKNLKNLQLDLVLNDDLLHCLSIRLVPLQNLSLCLKASSSSSSQNVEDHLSKEALHTLLKSQEKSLVNLTLGGLCKKSRLRIQFPTFQRLQVLQIQGWCHSIPGVEFSWFSYSQNFPALKDLVLDTWSFHPTWRQFLSNSNQLNGGESSNKITRIKLPQEMPELELISQDMPMTFGHHLKGLVLHFQPALTLHTSLLLESVFDNLRTLEELTILDSFCEFRSAQCIDPLLTGLDVEECQRMLRVNNFSSVMISEEEEEDNVLRRPSLACLKNLKFLDLSHVLKRQAMISDVTGYMLLNMKSLEHLKISRSKMRQNCFYQLYNKFPLDLKAEDLEFSQKESIRSINEPSTGSCHIM